LLWLLLQGIDGKGAHVNVTPAQARAFQEMFGDIKVVLGYGLGVDSTAILIRWLAQPWTMPCKPEELLVVTAMTGNEWDLTGKLVREHILPLLREHGIRYVQLARRGPSRANDGYIILSNSNCPTELYIEGCYKLGDEMNDNGTVPQVGGTRKCSIKAKGEVIDDFITDALGGRPFLHAIGFEANELGRALRDSKYNTGPEPKRGSPASRTGIYPLIEWNWDRAMCEAYITEMTGVNWIKSACTFCPFALANREGQARVMNMLSCEPHSGIGALTMEYRSISLNPTQGLIKTSSMLDLLRKAGRHNEMLREWGRSVAAMEWRIYEVQRVAMPTEKDASKGVWNRSVRSIAAGTRAEMLRDLQELAAAEGAVVEKDELAISRVWLTRRNEGFPCYERLYVVAPAGARDKEEKRFRTAMARYLAHVTAVTPVA
jgi:hypothetical protein